MNIARHVIFGGRVQGVGFRFTVFNIASRCQLTGYVRNVANGTVEMVAQGHADDVEDCIRDIRDTYSAHIADVEIEEADPNPAYTEFKITF